MPIESPMSFDVSELRARVREMFGAQWMPEGYTAPNNVVEWESCDAEWSTWRAMKSCGSWASSWAVSGRSDRAAVAKRIASLRRESFWRVRARS